MELLNTQDGEYADSGEVNAANGGQTYQEAYEAEARIRGVCPDCKVMHVWEHKKRTGGTEMWPSDQFRNCPKFFEMTPADKAARIERARGCPKCTSWRHGPQNCRNLRETICKMAVGNGVCDKPHLNMLHGSGNAYCQANHVLSVSTTPNGELVLLGVQQVQVL